MNKEPKFFKGRCDSCASETDVITICSVWGPWSFSVCKECLEQGKDPYKYIVYYIAGAGRWPEDINAGYQKLVREQLVLHGISEEQFKRDVQREFDDLMEIYREADLASYNDIHMEDFFD